jgi:hypothetical protein
MALRNLRIKWIGSTALVVLVILISQFALAQSLPPSSRTVYKCEVAGKTPCLDAVKIWAELRDQRCSLEQANEALSERY